MQRAALTVLRTHFARMVSHMPGTLDGANIEHLHQMRVATRRLRAAFRFFSDDLDIQKTKALERRLRKTGRALGRVRDLDVFWAHVTDYLAGVEPGARQDLTRLCKAWSDARSDRQARLRKYLQGKKYARLVSNFARFLHDNAVHAGGPQASSRLVCEAAPDLIRQRRDAVRAHNAIAGSGEPSLDQLHRLRIAAKQLRYALEFLRTALGPEAKYLIDQVKGLQDHLGALNDARVATALLSHYGSTGVIQGKKQAALTLGRSAASVGDGGASLYLAARRRELEHLRRTAPDAWRPVCSTSFDEAFSSALGHLAAPARATECVCHGHQRLYTDRPARQS